MTQSHRPFVEKLFRAYDEQALAAFRNAVYDPQAEAKPDGTTVTRVDREASRLVLETLKAHTPDYGILSEEEAEPYQPEAEWQWVVDPLDGTSSFARGYPVWGLGIGLMWRDQPREGYLRFPALSESYAYDGQTLTLNGRATAPVQNTPLPDTQNYLVDSSLHKVLRSYEPFHRVKLRLFGPSLYHLVCMAMGRAEAMISGRSYLWDFAAALPMTRARGLIERHVDGSPFDLGSMNRENRYRLPKPLIIGTPEQVDYLVPLLRKAL